MWNAVARIILKHKHTILIVVGVLTLFFAYSMTHLRMEYGYTPLMPESDSSYLKYMDFKHTYGEDAVMIVVGFQDENFLTLDKYRALKNFHQEVLKIHGVAKVQSYINTFDIVKDTVEKKFTAHKIFDKEPQSDAEVKAMFQKAVDFKYYSGLLFTDNNIFNIAIDCDPVIINTKSREVMIDSIENCVKQFSSQCNLDYKISGLPYTRTRMTTMIRNELIAFSVLAICIVAIIMFIFFRSARITLNSIIIVSIGVVWTLGTMALMGYKLTMLSGMLPALLIVIGIPNNVYLLNKYLVEYKAHHNKIKALYVVIIKVGKATCLTNATTAAGFVTFLITYNKMLVEFGIVATLGIIMMFLLSLTLVPCLYAFAPVPKDKQTKHLESKFITSIVDKIAYLVEYKRPAIYIGTVVVVLIAIVGVKMMKNESFVIDDLPENSKLSQDIRFFEKHIGGIMPYEISINTRQPKGIMKMSVLEKVEKLQDSLAHFNCLSKSSSIVDALKIIRRAYYNGNNDFYDLPTNQELAFIMPYLKGGQSNEAAKNMMHSMVDSSFSQLRITLKINDCGTARMIAVTDSVQNIVNHFFPKEKFDTDITGSSIIFTKGSLLLIDNLVQSLVLAIFLIAICMITLFSSWKMLFVSILPNFIPLIVTAAVMGYFGIRLKSSTILVFNIAFGISVDNAIHLLTKLRQEITDTKGGMQLSVHNSIRETGISIINSAMILLSGFLMFCFSQFGGTQAIGLLIGMTLFVAMFTNLLFLPTLIMSLKKRLLSKKQMDKIRQGN